MQSNKCIFTWGVGVSAVDDRKHSNNDVQRDLECDYIRSFSEASR